LRYYLVILRAIMLKGAGVESVWKETLALFIFGVAILVAASLRFRKRLD
jgi:ABC-2 type transport system permease protein